MISKISKRLAYFFVKKNYITKKDFDIYSYGYEIIIAEVINWLVTVVIMLLTGTILETIVYMYVFIQLRESMGGFHANSHTGCIVISNVVYILVLFIIKYMPLNMYMPFIAIGLVIHFIITLSIAPIAHVNKPFINSNERLKFKKKSYKLSIIYCVICLVCLITSYGILPVLSLCIILGMLSTCLSMLVEYIRQKYINF